MPKILAKAGDSLADVYDIEGSIAGVDELDTHDVNLFHEMGSTIFSERVRGSLFTFTTGAIAQNITWDLVVDMPPGLSRIHNWSVTASVTGRVDQAQLSIANRVLTDSPYWSWNTSRDVEKVIRVSLGAGPSGVSLLQVVDPQSPQMMSYGQLQPQAGLAVDQLIFRGVSSGFGAGTVTVQAVVYHAFAQTLRPSSRGLPVPSW